MSAVPLPDPPPVAGRRAVPVCHDDVCITCSDEAVEVRVTELLPDDLALVDTGVGTEEVSVALVEAGPGDRILVHAKEAIAVLGPDTGPDTGTGTESESV